MVIKKCGRYVLKCSGHMYKENIWDPKVLGNNYMLLPDMACHKEVVKCCVESMYWSILVGCVGKLCTSALEVVLLLWLVKWKRTKPELDTQFRALNSLPKCDAVFIFLNILWIKLILFDGIWEHIIRCPTQRRPGKVKPIQQLVYALLYDNFLWSCIFFHRVNCTECFTIN